MSTRSHAVRDSITMLRRDVKHSLRFPMMSVSGLLMPIGMLLLFVGVFGRTLSGGLGGSGGAAGGGYINFLTPGVLLMAAGAAAAATAVNVNVDMHQGGIVPRFRTMAITRSAVLTGQVLGAVSRTMISAVLVVAVAVGLGFRSPADPIAWLATAGLFALLTMALTWIAVAFGLKAKTPAGANSLSLILQFLPFLSSAFVPTDAMPTGVRIFAEYEPYTPVIDTFRGLMMGGQIGHNGVLAVAWCLGLATAGHLWSRTLYDRGPATQA
ncbi:ABC transporter permease [Kitasatospora sp. NPDC127067]|uniref:ABC transporter permease n=1 Tax=Kitasatospora sp. NPDC127067 TaxID=3347126 RepID=UPI003667E47D